MTPIRVAVAGCTGRTGSAVLRLAAADAAFRVVAALTHAEDPLLGEDAARLADCEGPFVPIRAECAVDCDVLIEFTLPAGCRYWADWCAANGVALVSGTTGLENAERQALRAAAERVPIVWAPNMSIGVNVLLGLIAQAAQRLDESWDVEITETHHRHKVDAPSGTAHAMLEAVCRARGGRPEECAVFGRHGAPGARRPGEIGVHALRMGEIVGEHEISFGSASEALSLRHRAFSRDTFAAGALRAARWISGRTAKLYTMQDVLGLTE